MPGWFLGRDIDPAGLHWSWRLWGSIPHVGFADAPGWFRGRDLYPWLVAFVHGDPWGSIPRIGLEAGMNGDWWTAWERDPDPDPVIAARCDIGSTIMHESRGELVRFKPDPRGADPLRRACRVCGAAGGVPCDPERLGKAGRRGAVAHRSR